MGVIMQNDDKFMERVHTLGILTLFGGVSALWVTSSIKWAPVGAIAGLFLGLAYLYLSCRRSGVKKNNGTVEEVSSIQMVGNTKGPINV